MGKSVILANSQSSFRRLLVSGSDVGGSFILPIVDSNASTRGCGKKSGIDARYSLANSSLPSHCLRTRHGVSLVIG